MVKEQKRIENILYNTLRFVINIKEEETLIKHNKDGKYRRNKMK